MLLAVAEAQDNAVGIPAILEAAETELEAKEIAARLGFRSAEIELEATVRVSEHAWHPVVAAGVLPQSILLIEGDRPLPFREFASFQLIHQRHALGTGEDCADRFVEAEAIVGCGRLTNREELRQVGFPGNELLRRIPEVPVGDRVVEEVELLALQRVELRSVIVVLGDRDQEFLEEFETRFDGRNFLARKNGFTLFFRQIIEPFQLREGHLTATHFLERVDLQTSQFGRIYADNSFHRFCLSVKDLLETAKSGVRASYGVHYSMKYAVSSSPRPGPLHR